MMQGQNHLLKMNKSKTKKMIDPEDDDWKCKICGCPAQHTPLKRTGRDGKKSICNACYIRERTQQERAERGSARPVLTTTVPMTTANILSNPQQNFLFPCWNFLPNLNMVQQMSLLSKMGQSFGVESQQLFAHSAFGLTPEAISAAIQAYQAAAATASGQLNVDYNANLNMLSALGSLGLATAAATTQTTETENSESVLSEQDIEQSVQVMQQSDLSQEIKTDDEDSSKQDLESVQQQIQQITSASISDLANLSAAVDGNDVLNNTNAFLTESFYNQQTFTAAVTALNQAQLNIKNEELLKEKINKEIKNLQETQLGKTEEIKKIQKDTQDSVDSHLKSEEKVEEKKVFPKRRQMDEEENLLEEKIKKELKRVKVDAK